MVGAEGEGETFGVRYHDTEVGVGVVSRWSIRGKAVTGVRTQGVLTTGELFYCVGQQRSSLAVNNHR